MPRKAGGIGTRAVPNPFSMMEVRKRKFTTTSMFSIVMRPSVFYPAVRSEWYASSSSLEKTILSS